MRFRWPISFAALAAVLLTGLSLPAAAPDETTPVAVPLASPDKTAPGPDDRPKPGDKPLEPCGEATDYEARQAGEVITITAQGEHPTAGFKVVLERSPLRIFPPELILKHDAPDGMAAQVITPFRVSAKINVGDQEIATVIVHDAKGRHEVKVLRGGPDAGDTGDPR